MKMGFHRAGQTGAGAGAGFTLVEILVALAVFSLLVAMFAQILTMSGGAISLGLRRLEASAQARLVLDRIGADLAARPDRADLPVLFTSQAGNDTFMFYSQVSGYGGNAAAPRPLSLVGYKISLPTATPPLQLQRGAGAEATTWTQTPSFFQATTVTSTPALAISSNDYDILSPDVFRLEFMYLLNSSGSDGKGMNAGTLSTTANSDLSNVAAIVVAVAALDANNQKIVSTAQLQTVSTTLLTDAKSGADIASTWQGNLAGAGSNPSISKTAAQAVRVYERYFYVH